MSHDPHGIREASWRREDGHASEHALQYVLDGEASVPPDVAAHVEHCNPCTDRMVARAAASSEVGDWVRASAVAPAAQAPLPLAWVALAATLGLAATLPAIARLPVFLARVAPVMTHGVPVLVRGAAAALAARGPELPAFVTSLLFIVVGVLVSRGIRQSGVVSS